MSIAHVVVTGSTAAVLSFSVIADHLLRDRVLANMDRAGVPWSWLPTLAGLRIAGALGLIVGLALPAIGIAAAVGVIVYFLAAIVTHLRARWYDISYPAGYLLLATASLILALAS